MDGVCATKSRVLIELTPDSALTDYRASPVDARRTPSFNGFPPHAILSLFFTLSGRIVRLMATTTRDAIEELLQTYGETGGINYLAAAASLPSRLSIEAACTELMSLMFPGFRSEALVSSEDLADTTRIRVRHLHARLKTEICRSLGRIPPDQATEAKAEEVLAEFFKQLPSVRRMLWTDIDAAYEGDPAATTYEEIILAYPSLEAIAIYRMAHLLYGKVPLIPRIMTEWAHSRTGIDIHPGAEIGSHFFIDHGTGVVVGETTQIGSHVKLYQGVSFIARSLGAGQAIAWKKTPPDDRRRRLHLRRNHDHGRRHRDWREFHDRRQRFPDKKRSTAFARLLRRKRSSCRAETKTRDRNRTR